MPKVGINSVTNANVYLDGQNLLGRAQEITLPEPTQKMIEHTGLGMIGTIEIPGGGFEALEASFTWASYYPDVMKKAGNARRSVQLQVRAVLESYTGQGLQDEQPVIITLGGVFKTSNLGSFQQHESVQPENTMTVYFMRQVIGGEEILEIDVMNNVYRVAGEDVLAQYRALIGG